MYDMHDLSGLEKTTSLSKNDRIIEHILSLIRLPTSYWDVFRKVGIRYGTEEARNLLLQYAKEGHFKILMGPAGTYCLMTNEMFEHHYKIDRCLDVLSRF